VIWGGALVDAYFLWRGRCFTLNVFAVKSTRLLWVCMKLSGVMTWCGLAAFGAQGHASTAVVDSAIDRDGGCFHVFPYKIQSYPARAYVYHTVDDEYFASGKFAIV
jgi:hypothetical protein